VTDEYNEEKKSGNVTWSVYLTYFTVGIGYFGMLVLSITFVIVQAFLTGADYWISYWFVLAFFIFVENFESIVMIELKGE
jgi:hypothetical protein